MNEDDRLNYAKSLVYDLEGGMSQILNQHAVLTDEQKDLLDDIGELEKEIEQRKRQNYTAQERKDYFEEKLFSIQERHYLKNQARLKRLAREGEAVKAEYEKRKKKEAAEDLLQFQRFTLRYAGMNKEQLVGEANAFLTSDNGKEWSPDRIQILSEALRKKKVTKIGLGQPPQQKTLQEWASERDLDRPWKYDDPVLFDSIRLYSAEFGSTRVLDETHKEFIDIDLVDIIENKEAER